MQEPSRLALIAAADTLAINPVVQMIFRLGDDIVAGDGMTILPPTLNPLAGRRHTQRRAVERPVATHDELNRLIEEPRRPRQVTRQVRAR
jgi:hypothetical protein